MLYLLFNFRFQFSKMKKLFSILIFALSFCVSAYDKNERTEENSYNPHSYGAPTLYYSPEARREREEIQELRNSNRIAKERLEVEKEQLQELREIRENE